MDYLDPQQELFIALKLGIEAIGYAVYDGVLPPENTPYPFVYMGEFRQTDNQNKSKINGLVYSTIHVWSDTPKNRGTVSKILLDIKGVCRKIGHTKNFAWVLRSVNQGIMPDNTTKTPLLHGYVDLEFYFS